MIDPLDRPMSAKSPHMGGVGSPVSSIHSGYSGGPVSTSTPVKHASRLSPKSAGMRALPFSTPIPPLSLAKVTPRDSIGSGRHPLSGRPQVSVRTGAIRDAAKDILGLILSQLSVPDPPTVISVPQAVSPVAMMSSSTPAVSLHGDSIAGLQAFTLMSQLQVGSQKLFKLFELPA